MTQFQQEFIQIATALPTVVACRCSPTQKADVARLIRSYTKKRVCCIGDGGNDVSMIQAADVGLGIVGKEGKQASLAADFSILQFSYLSKLLCWHGRNSYKRSAKLAQFVVHRGLLVAVIQAVFSCIVYFSPVAIFQDWLSVGYATMCVSLTLLALSSSPAPDTRWVQSSAWCSTPISTRTWPFSTPSSMLNLPK
jgi:phospholipid-translocating ATPase